MNLEITTRHRIQRIVQEWRQALKPPRKLKLSEWADEHRVLSREASAEAGRWSTDRAPYQREMMDSIHEDAVYEVVVVAGSQLGKSEGVINNSIGYHMHIDPCPMLFVLPSDTLAEDYSKERIAPMLRDTPVLAERVADPKSRNSGNTILKKLFPGGVLTMLGANTPRKLASKPIRIVFFDEIDGYVDSAGTEGDPITLAKKRTDTFPNRKWIMTSTPLDAETSKIKAEFEQSDQRYFNVPCPHCDELQQLLFPQLQFEKDENGALIDESVRYVCQHCGALIFEKDKPGMLERGVWIATAPFNGIAGFRINSLYSPFRPWVEIAREFLAAKDDPEKLKVFVNTVLAEWWEGRGETVDDGKLYNRREQYSAEVPQDAFVLTCGVDVQKDRLESLVYGWGLGEEAWAIQHATFWGDPNEIHVWNDLEIYLQKQFQHESGPKIGISGTAIDSGGHHTQMVYDFVKKLNNKRIFAIKGQGGEGRPIIGPPSRKRTGKDQRTVELHMLGVDAIKELVYMRLRKTEPGPCYFHFHNDLSEEFFKQLTGEKVVLKKNQRGIRERIWVPRRPRVEALDMTNYAYAALKRLPPNWEDWKGRLAAAADPQKPPPQPTHRQRRIRSQGIRTYGR